MVRLKGFTVGVPEDDTVEEIEDEEVAAGGGTAVWNKYGLM